jgi:hypothetical protein
MRRLPRLREDRRGLPETPRGARTARLAGAEEADEFRGTTWVPSSLMTGPLSIVTLFPSGNNPRKYALGQPVLPYGLLSFRFL